MLYSGLLRCHRSLGWWCLSHVKGHSSHALLRGLDGVTLVVRKLRRVIDKHLTSTLRGEGVIHDVVMQQEASGGGPRFSF